MVIDSPSTPILVSPQDGPPVQPQGLFGTVLPAKKAPRLDYRTPLALFYRLNSLYGPFVLDAAADEESRLCNAYLGPGSPYLEDALGVGDWPGDGAVFLNPPYQDVQRWVRRAHWEAQLRTGPVVMVLADSTGDAWFRYALEHAHEIRMLGRVAFINPRTNKPDTAPRNGNVAIVFRRSPRIALGVDYLNWRDSRDTVR